MEMVIVWILPGTFLDHLTSQLVTPNDNVLLTTINSASNGGEAEDNHLLSIFSLDFTQHNTGRLHQEIVGQLYRQFILKLSLLLL